MPGCPCECLPHSASPCVFLRSVNFAHFSLCSGTLSTAGKKPISLPAVKSPFGSGKTPLLSTLLFRTSANGSFILLLAGNGPASPVPPAGSRLGGTVADVLGGRPGYRDRPSQIIPLGVDVEVFQPDQSGSGVDSVFARMGQPRAASGGWVLGPVLTGERSALLLNAASDTDWLARGGHSLLC